MNYDQIFDNNRLWVAEKTAENDDFFSSQGIGQHPAYLVIACSDSRVPIEKITCAEPGDMFVHKNVANIVSASDTSVMTVIDFAVRNLKVKHIVVCGHTHCGGVQAVFDSPDTGSLEPWLKIVREIKEKNSTATLNELIDLNTLEQCRRLNKMEVVKESIANTGFPIIHGWNYNIETGILSDLQIS